MNVNDITSKIDLTPTFSESMTWESVEDAIALAKKYQFSTVLASPSLLPRLIAETKDDENIAILAPTGGQDGWNSTDIKVAEVKRSIELGCDEIDTIMDIGRFKSGLYDEVLEDLKTVVAASGDKVIKVIIEAPLLTDEELVKATEIVIASGAEYVKMNVGNHGIATPEQTKLVKDVAGDRIKVKACGVGDLDVFLDLLDYGIDRFGIGTKKVESLIEQAMNRTE